MSFYVMKSIFGFLSYRKVTMGSIPGQGTKIPYVMQKWPKKRKKENSSFLSSDTSTWPTEVSWKYSVKLL